MSDDQNLEEEKTIPYVVGMKNGGPYDEESFYAGYQLGIIKLTLDSLLVLSITRTATVVPVKLLPEIDIMAMALGWSIETEPLENACDEYVDDHVQATFNVMTVKEDIEELGDYNG